MNYTIYHLHSDFSNCVTNIDSVTHVEDYVKAAKECGMTALGFSEHGSVYSWWHKKCAIEESGMKYIHGVEMYLTETLDDKIRDNYHCVLIAKNYEGFKEINKLVTKSFNRKDNHFYYMPRISFDELFDTSDNIIITTACIGGVFGKGTETAISRYKNYLISQPNKCFIEIQHHPDEQQIKYNQQMYNLSKQYGLKLIAGTDTHALNQTHIEGRKVLQKAKKINFPNEDSWDLTFKTYDELCQAYTKQNSLDKSVWLEAIENTNLLASMVEPFEISKAHKYPKIYDNPNQMFRSHIEEKRKTHPYINDKYDKELVDNIIQTELSAYETTGAVEFMLLQEYLRDWEKRNNIQCGYSRGSVSGSLIAYILGITQMDSIKFNLNFFRFINPERVSLADIDTDYGKKDRDKVKSFLLNDHMNLPNLKSCEIITFNTIALKGAIRDVGRALDIPLDIVDGIAKDCEAEEDIEKYRKKYTELFKYVDIVSGTIVSVGAHASGVLISDLDIKGEVGLSTTSTSDYYSSMLNMKELESLKFLKLDLLGLDNISVINDTCKMVDIDRLTPDNVNLDDMDVWKSIRNDTTCIFQWESASSAAYLKRIMSDTTLGKVKSIIPNFSMIKWFSFANGLIRPACASFRNEVADGIFYDNGLEELNKFLANEMGHCTMQETIMQFLVKFCGYTQGGSDNVRRAIGHKLNTEQLLPEIKQKFIDFSSTQYNISKEKCEKVIDPFLQVILDASSYAFSWNHSDSYSCVGYICGYLRHYYPLEFITASFNTFADDMDKIADITKYANKVKIKIKPIKFRHSRAEYNYDKTGNSIYKGVASIKYLNSNVAEELYNLRENKYNSFIDLLTDVKNNSRLDSQQLKILIKLEYFSEFGNAKELMRIVDIFNLFKQGAAKKISKDDIPEQIEELIEPYLNKNRKDGSPAKNYTILDASAIMKTIEAYIKKLDIPDFSIKDKVQDQKDYLGYIDIKTGKEEDRPKLYIKDIYPAKRKKDNKQFGYNITTRSIGSGIESRFTIFNSTYNETPVSKGDVIYCNKYTSDGIYFTLKSYDIII